MEYVKQSRVGMEDGSDRELADEREEYILPDDIPPDDTPQEEHGSENQQAEGDAADASIKVSIRRVRSVLSSSQNVTRSDRRRRRRGARRKARAPRKTAVPRVGVKVKGTEKLKPRRAKRPVFQICKVCNKELRSRSSVFRHKTCGQPRLPLSAETYRCRFCLKKIANKHYVKVHERLHTGELPFACSRCDKAYISAKGLKDHVVREHTAAQEHTCETCGKTFSMACYLYAHLKAVHQERNVLCETCGKAFKNKAALTVHRETHMGEAARVECVECGKMFKTKKTLRYHMQTTHSEEHACDVCYKTLKSKKSLQKHVRTCHDGERPYACQYCEKRFACSSNVKVHERVHTGERPYQCEACGKTFNQSHVLKTHKMKCIKGDSS